VRAGEPITVTNDDGVVHTVTAVKGEFDTGDVAGGATAEIVVDRPGTYAYYCLIHQYMRGTIDVD
jgi:plastocyanin